MRKLTTYLSAAMVAVLLSATASGAPAVPPPTAKVYWEATEAGLGQMTAPGVSAAWTVAKPGHDATFQLSGPMALWSVVVDAIWTSDLLTVRSRGAKVATVDLTWSANEPVANPLSGGQTYAVNIRFTDVKGRWGAWTTVAKPVLTAPRTAPVTEQHLTLPVKFVGAPPKGKIRAQVQLRYDGNNTYVQSQKMRVTA